MKLKFNPNNKRIQKLMARCGTLEELCEEDDSCWEDLFEAQIELIDAVYCDGMKNQGSQVSGFMIG